MRRQWIASLSRRKAGKTDMILFVLLFGSLVYLGCFLGRADGLFRRDISLIHPFLARMDGQGNTYVIDQEHTRVLKLNPDREVLVSIRQSGGKITYVSDLAIAENGDIYIEETHWGGLYVDREAILVYDGQGRFQTTAYEAVYEEEYVDKRRIYGMTVWEGNLYFAVLYPDSIRVNRLSDGSRAADCIGVIPCENAYHALYDVCILPESGTVFLLDKRGRVVRAKGQEQEILYSSREDEGRAGQTALYSMTADHRGRVYLTDIKGNMVFRLDNGSLTPLLLGGAALTVRADRTTDGGVTLSAIYDEKLCQTDGQGRVLFSSGSLEKSRKLRIFTGSLYLAMTLCLLSVIWFAVRAASVLRGVILPASVKKGILLTAAVSSVAAVIVIQLMHSFQSVYTEELFARLYLSAHYVSGQLDAELLREIDSPEDFMSDAYNRLTACLEKLLDRKYDYNQNIYCNILKYEEGEAFSIAYLDQSTGTYYPLDEVETEEVWYVYETGNDLQNGGKADVAGSFAYVKVPVFDSQGKVAAVVAVGSDTSIMLRQTASMRRQVLLTLVTLILVLLFVFGEALGFYELRGRYRKEAALRPQAVPLHRVRFGIFVTFVAFNMATSFLSVYAAGLAGERPGMAVGLASSLPVTLNLAFMGVTSLFCAPLLRRFSLRRIAAVSAGISFLGDMTVFAGGSYEALLCGLILNGAGAGLITNSVTMFLASAKDPDLKRDGFSIFNSASVSGINIGSMAGAFLAGVLGQRQVFAVSAAGWLLVGFVFLRIGRRLDVETGGERKKERGAGRFLLSLPVCGYLLCIQIPYLLLNSFIFYYVPLYSAGQGYSESATCLLLMVHSLCSVFFSVPLTDFLLRTCGRRAVALSTAMSLAALLFFAARPSTGVLIAALFVMGVSGSFGVSSRSVCFTRLPQVRAFGEERAAGIYNLSEHVGEAAGPLIFGPLMASGNLLLAMSRFAAVVFAAGAFYGLGGRRKKRRGP